MRGLALTKTLSAIPAERDEKVCTHRRSRTASLPSSSSPKHNTVRPVVGCVRREKKREPGARSQSLASAGANRC